MFKFLILLDSHLAIHIVFHNHWMDVISIILDISDNSSKSPIILVCVKSISIIWPIIRKWPLYPLLITFSMNSPKNQVLRQIWKKWSYFTIQDVQRVLLCYLCTDFKDNFIFVWDMKHSLSCFLLSIGCIGWNLMLIFRYRWFFDNPQMIFFISIIWKNYIWKIINEF